MKYLRSIVHETDWQGDHVKAEMEPLDRESFFEMSAERGKPGDQLAVYAAGVKILQKHLKKLSGLVDASNAPIDIETVLGKVFFMSLVNELFAALMRGSTLGEARKGDSAEKSPAGTEAPK